MKGQRTKFLLIPLTLAILLSISFAHPLSAHAATTNTASKPHLFLKQNQARPAAATPADNLMYNGGPVMARQAKVYLIFWEPTGSFVTPRYNALITRYFKDIGSSPLYRNNRQYTDTTGKAPTGATLAASWTDTHPYPEAQMLDSEIQDEVTFAQGQNGWTSSIDHVFFVILAKGEDLCIDTQRTICFSNIFCAYHNFFGTNTIYSPMPYVNGIPGCIVPNTPNGDFDADSTINVISHEQNESATDPLLNAWFDASGNEIGDKCNFTFGPFNAHGGDVDWHHHIYEVQEEWDNAKDGCVTRGP